MRKPRTFTRTLLVAVLVALTSTGPMASPAHADTMVGACNVVSNPTSVTHTECIGAAPTGGDFTGFDLSFADFTGSNLAGTDFTGANLTDAGFTGSSAAGTIFTDATLTGADFTGANIAGAVFSGASVIPTDVTVVSSDGNPATYVLPAIGNALTRECTPVGPYVVGATTIFCTLSTVGTITTSAESTFTITVVVAPTLTGPAAVAFAAGNAGSYVLTTLTGSPAPTVNAVGLPTGLAVNPATGAIAGTPVSGTGGIYAVTLTASNGATPDGTLSITLTVNEALAISGSPSATFTEDELGGSYLPTVTGFPAPTFSASGLPEGLSIDSTTGEITGTPDDGSDGTYPIVITAGNGSGPAVTLNVSITIEPNASSPEPTPPAAPAEPTDQSGGDGALLPDTGGVPLGFLLLGVALTAAGALALRHQPTSRHRI